MGLRRFRYFLAVADRLHFGQAAAALGMSQPPLSQHIQLLEQELGFALFDRSTRRVRLTEAGRLFLDEAREVVARADAALNVAKRIASGQIGELRIGMTTSTPLVANAGRIISAFHARYPDARLSVREMPTAPQIEALLAGQLHVGIVRLPGDRSWPPPGVESLLIDREPLSVLMRENHPLCRQEAITLAELKSEPFVMFSEAARSVLRDQVVQSCEQAGFAPIIAQEAREPVMLCGLAAAGVGIAIMPASFSRIGVAGLAVRPIRDVVPMLESWIIHRDGDGALPVAARFVETARALLAEAQADGR